MAKLVAWVMTSATTFMVIAMAFEVDSLGIEEEAVDKVIVDMEASVSTVVAVRTITTGTSYTIGLLCYL